MRVLLADDEVNVRSALKLLIEQESGMSVAGEAINSLELMAKAGEIRPDLILLDWELPGQRDSEIMTKLHKAYPEIRTIVLSSQPDARKKALIDGANAFVSKEEPPERLIAVLRGCQHQKATLKRNRGKIRC